ncbi:MAG: hypothetical protein NXH95_02590 [Pseudomonadaceae bacterium]|nr:hypothetical protein [Pseudomonadaceae bacterium]
MIDKDKFDEIFKPAQPGEFEQSLNDPDMKVWPNALSRATLPLLRNFHLDEALTWLHGNGYTARQWIKEMTNSERREAKLAGSPLPGVPGWVKELPNRKEGKQDD